MIRVRRKVSKPFIQALFLGIRATFFVVIIPGTVTVYIPYRIPRSGGRVIDPEWTSSSVVASVLVAVGAAMIVSSVWHFAVAGRGTLAPVDPPRKLVVAGLYRFTRNPMYNGVLAVLLGEAWFFGSMSLLTYAGTALVVFHLVVVLYEEPALETKFGESYVRYRRSVPRWGVALRPADASPRRSD